MQRSERRSACNFLKSLKRELPINFRIYLDGVRFHLNRCPELYDSCAGLRECPDCPFGAYRVYDHRSYDVQLGSEARLLDGLEDLFIPFRRKMGESRFCEAADGAELRPRRKCRAPGRVLREERMRFSESMRSL